MLSYHRKYVKRKKNEKDTVRINFTITVLLNNWDSKIKSESSSIITPSAHSRFPTGPLRRAVSSHLFYQVWGRFYLFYAHTQLINPSLVIWSQNSLCSVINMSSPVS